MLKTAIFLLLGFSIAYSACSSPNEQKPADKKTATTVYFDIPLFFEQQAESLGKRKVQKKVQYQDKSETKEVLFSNPDDWKKEFALFAQTQLNTPALAEAYIIDTLRQNQDTLHYAVRYTAKQPEKLYVQSVDIFFKQPQLVQSLGIVLYNNNFLAPSTYFLQYEVEQGYSIHVTKDMPLDSFSQIHLSAVFLPS